MWCTTAEGPRNRRIRQSKHTLYLGVGCLDTAFIESYLHLSSWIFYRRSAQQGCCLRVMQLRLAVEPSVCVLIAELASAHQGAIRQAGSAVIAAETCHSFSLALIHAWHRLTASEATQMATHCTVCNPVRHQVSVTHASHPCPWGLIHWTYLKNVMSLYWRENNDKPIHAWYDLQNLKVIKIFDTY